MNVKERHVGSTSPSEVHIGGRQSEERGADPAIEGNQRLSIQRLPHDPPELSEQPVQVVQDEIRGKEAKRDASAEAPVRGGVGRLVEALLGVHDPDNSRASGLG